MSFGRKPLANLQELEAAAARSGMIGNDEIANGVRWIRS